ncbi:unnamed protein product, partial [Allacma fusca]
MGTDLGLTYNIAFPDSGKACKQESSPYEDLQNLHDDGVVEGEKPIVVILLGWMKAKDSQLEKYSNIYLKRGCIILRCMTPVRVLLYDGGKMPALARQVIDIVKDNQLQAHPKFFHVFSNTGGSLYSFILREISSQSNPADFNIRGTIFDSAPFFLTAKTYYNILLTTASSYKILGVSLGPAIACGYLLVICLWTPSMTIRLGWELFFNWFLKRISANYKDEPSSPSNFLTYIWQIRNHSFAFLYSEKDRITPFKHVEGIAEALRSRGNSVKLVKFDGSAHVQHYKMYPEEYISAVIDFVRSTMETNVGAKDRHDSIQNHNYMEEFSSYSLNSTEGSEL